MRQALLVALIVALASLTWLGVETALTVRAWRGVPDAALALTSEQLTALQTMTDCRLASLEAKTDAQMTAIRADVVGRMDTLIGRIDDRAGEAIARADARMGETTAVVTQVADQAVASMASIEPTVQVVNHLAPSLMRNALGTIAAAKVTAGETALTMRTIREAAPEITSSITASAVASQEAAASAALTSQNLAKLTRPGPTWLRYLGLGLTVAAPASQVAFPFILKGQLK